MTKKQTSILIQINVHHTESHSLKESIGRREGNVTIPPHRVEPFSETLSHSTAMNLPIIRCCTGPSDGVINHHACQNHQLVMDSIPADAHTREVFYVGGEYVDDGTGNETVYGQVYVEHLVPVRKPLQKYPIIFIPGSSRTGIVGHIVWANLDSPQLTHHPGLPHHPSQQRQQHQLAHPTKLVLPLPLPLPRALPHRPPLPRPLPLAPPHPPLLLLLPIPHLRRGPPPKSLGHPALLHPMA